AGASAGPGVHPVARCAPRRWSAAASAISGAPTRRWCSAWPPRWRCSRGRSWSATPCGGASSRPRSSASAAREGRDALVSEALAREVGGEPGATLLLRVAAPPGVPASSLFGRRDEPGHTIRLTLKAVLPPHALGEFSLQPRPQEVRALFLPLRLLQPSIGQEDKVNTVLVAGQASEGDLVRALGGAARIEDLGLRLRILPGQ